MSFRKGSGAIIFLSMDRMLDNCFFSRPVRSFYYTHVMLSNIKNDSKVQDAEKRLRRNSTIQQMTVRGHMVDRDGYFKWVKKTSPMDYAFKPTQEQRQSFEAIGLPLVSFT